MQYHDDFYDLLGDPNVPQANPNINFHLFDFRATTNPILKENSEIAKSFIESYERMNHLGGQDDPSKGKSLRGLEEHWGCEGEFMLNWKGRGYTTILDVLLVSS